MNVLIKNALIIDPGSPFNGSTTNILIEKGVITHIGSDTPPAADRVVSGDSLHVSPGWVDIFADFSDPGFENRESLESGAKAAAAGGFTDVFLIPNTKPVTDNKAQVEYLRRQGGRLVSNIHPIGAISRNAEGKDLAEMYDMRNNGAVAFSDGLNPVQSAGLLLKALQYVKAFEGVVIQIPDDKSVGANGQMHEGVMSTRLGLAGKPLMAEELLVARDIKLARYADSKLHFTGITSPRSLEYIQRARQAGLQVTCSVTPHHLFFTDNDLSDYDSNLKVYPPIRSANERAALREAVKNGMVDCVATHHMPQDYDSKVLEFEYAKNGMIGLETCYATLKTALPEVSEQRWVELLSVNPRKIFGLPQPAVRTGSPACLTLFDPDQQSIFVSGSLRSKSANTPFLDKTLNGRVLGVINGEQVSLSL